MTKAEIKELMDFFGEKQGINELKIKDKDFEIEIKKYGPGGGSTPQLAAPAPAPQLAAPAVNVLVGDKPASKGARAADTGS